MMTPRDLDHLAHTRRIARIDAAARLALVAAVFAALFALAAAAP